MEIPPTQLGDNSIQYEFRVFRYISLMKCLRLIESILKVEHEDCSAKLDFFVFPLFVSCLIYFRMKVIVLWLFDDENGYKKMEKAVFEK